MAERNKAQEAKKPASTLLLESAAPFDRACVQVQRMELLVRCLLENDGGHLSKRHDASTCGKIRDELAALVGGL